MNKNVLIVVLIFTLLGVVILTPVAHPNQSFSLTQKKRLKKLAIVYGVVLFAFEMLMLKFLKLQYCVTVELCVLVVFINQIVGIVIYKNRRISHETECSNLR